MKSFLTATLLSCCFSIAFAQKPGLIPENTCNFAGTISQGQFIGQSTETSFDTIFLCYGDSILIDHQGDAILTGDPNPATPAGIGYAYYACPPTVSGDNLQAITSNPGPGDPCVWSVPPAPNGLYITQAVPNGGDTWFFNSGAIQNTLNSGQPVQIFFAPLTIDDWEHNSFEAAAIGLPPGPCVHVNTAESFSVVYLNELTVNSVSNNFGDDCLARFRLNGAFPEFNNLATYAIDISLTSDPSVKALIHTPAAENFHGSVSIFSVSEPGIYTVSVEDGISCGLNFQVDMSGCDPSNNLVVKIDSLAAAGGNSVCVPVRVRNFNIASGNLSFFWDAQKLHFQSLENINPGISFFNPATSLNTSQAAQGEIGVVIANLAAPDVAISIPNDSILFELCFEVLDSVDCASIGVGPNPAEIAFENPDGGPLAVTAIPGSGCSEVPAVFTQEPLVHKGSLIPNPVRSGDPATLDVWSDHLSPGRLLIQNLQGQLVREETIQLFSGANQLRISTEKLIAGIYAVRILNNDNKEMASHKLLVIEN